MTDKISDNPARTADVPGAPSAAQAARESHAGPGDRRGPAEGVSSMPHPADAPAAAGHRPAVSASASQAAELARLSLGVAGLALTLLMVWLMFSSASSPWAKRLPDAAGVSAAAPPGDALAMAHQAGACGTPVTMGTAPGDGKLPLKADVTGLMAADIESFVVIGKEAAAAGRPRDAESAFLMSCRVAAQVKGAESLESARAKYQLGWLYAQLAVTGDNATDGVRDEMIGRAAQLYAESLRLFVTHADQAGKKPQLVVEAPMPFSPAPAGGVSTSGAAPFVASEAVARAPAPVEQAVPSPVNTASSSASLAPDGVRAEQASAKTAPVGPDSSPAAVILAVKPPSAAPPAAASRNRAHTAVVKRSERRIRIERKVISASAAANIAELYRGR